MLLCKSNNASFPALNDSLSLEVAGNEKHGNTIAKHGSFCYYQSRARASSCIWISGAEALALAPMDGMVFPSLKLYQHQERSNWHQQGKWDTGGCS